MQTKLNILHLEDDRLDAELIRDTLCAQGLLTNILQVETEDAFRAALHDRGIELVLADYSLPGFDGLSALKITREMNPDLPFIFVSGTIGDEVAVESLKSGATDYVLKDFLQRLGSSVRRALSEVEERTRRKVGDQALRDSEVRYRRLFESAKDGILILDADSGRIVDANPFLMEMLAYSREELMGKRLWELGVFKDVIASQTAFSKLQREGYIRYEDLPLQNRGGLVRQVEFVSNSYLEGEGRVIQCNIRDITPHKQIEETLRETNHSLAQALSALQTKTQELTTMTQQLWQASKLTTMGELAASVAHELNNPLATVALHTESVMEDLPKDDPKRRGLEVIAQEVERMATLVSNLLQFSRRSHRQISSIDLPEELRYSLDFIEYHLRSHQINIVQEFASDLPCVQADRQQLRQVFLNLITNASDAMPSGGTLTVRAFPGVLGLGNAAVIIEFSDTGTGIQTGDLAKIWEPFFTTKPEGKGTGLGLAICRRTVEEHYGTIEIETGPEKGTTVRIALPATDTDETTRHE